MKTATEKRTAHIEVRSQHAKGTWPKQGPDVYVAVQIVPDGMQKLSCLNEKHAEKRGIEIIYCGEGYSKNNGPRSAYGQALAEAHKIADKVNGEENK